MDKKKQIEDMAILIRTGIALGCSPKMIAEVVYDDGFQKQIVMCEDCKYFDSGKTFCNRCGGMARIRADGESFCSLAEMKEREGLKGGIE